MFRSTCSLALAAAVASCATSAAAAEYRGMTAGWPYYASGYYAGYAPATYATTGGYYAARPVTVAYANPNYLAAYGAGNGNAATAYRPTVAAAGYYQQPAAAYYAPAYGAAPAAAYYPPQTAYYAPSQSYAISPAGGSSAGSEAAAYYGQPMTLNYVPPRYAYRTMYAPVPVYMYRPVTVYDPVVAQPTTCLQPQVPSTCQPQRTHWLSWLHPHNWFRGHSWYGGSSCCGYRGCGSPPVTAAYCPTNYCQTPQPYYPVVPQPAVIPTVPAVTTPPTLAPGSTIIPQAGPRVPSPPTRILPGTSTGGAADFQPRIIPNTTTPPTTSPNIPFTPIPGSSAPLPGTTTPPGSFGTGTGYAPASDPYRSSSTSSNTKTSGPVIRAPELNSPLPASVQPVPDLDARQPVAPLNRAPQLLAPRDKTAAHGDSRWAVVPAVWPSQAAQPASVRRPVMSTNAAEPAPVNSPKYDDSGWTSGRSW